MAEILTKSQATGIKDVMLVLALFVALWFDPRITYLQRDISAVAEHSNQIDAQGTRHSQLDLAHVSEQLRDNTIRIGALEEQSRHIDATLTAILQKLSDKR